MLRSLLIAILIISFHSTRAQTETWPTPEIGQMYQEARNLLSGGSIPEAIDLFRQAIRLAPNTTILYRDLAQALKVSGKHQEAYETLEPLIERGKADEQSFQIAISAALAGGQKKIAKSALDKALVAYPSSGLLYHELGNYYLASEDREEALRAWLKGIKTDPAYHLNYFEAATAYHDLQEPVWAILYAEIFVNLERQTARSQEIKKMLIAAYQKLFKSAASETRRYGEQTNESVNLDFEGSVRQIFFQLAPVVSDGFTTENLIMLRTRFIANWVNSYGGKYPFTLFIYQDDMLRDGQFDAYNQWLFGKAENPGQFESWTKFHSTAIPDYESWLLKKPFHPVAGDYYENRNLAGLFSKKSIKRKS